MTRIQSKLDIKNNVGLLRVELGLTQEQLGLEVGVTRATINALEKGNYNPSLELAFRLSKFFNARIEDIFWENNVE